MKKVSEEKVSTIITFIAGAVILGLILSWAFFLRNDNKNDEHAIHDCSIYLNDEAYFEGDIHDVYFDTLNHGDIVSLIFTLPNINLNQFVILEAKYAGLSVYDMDENPDTPFFEFSMDRFNSGQFIGKDMVFIPISKDNSVHRIKINFYISSKDAFKYMSIPYIESADVAFYSFINGRGLMLCITAFLLIYGMLVIISSHSISNMTSEAKGLAYIGIFSVLIASWYLAGSYLIRTSESGAYINTMVEYETLYCLDIPLIAFFIKHLDKEDIENTIQKIVLFINLCFFVITNVLHFANIVFITESFYLKFILFGVDMVLLLIILTRSIIKGDNNKIILSGCIIFAVTLMVDIVHFAFLLKYTRGYVYLGLIGTLFLIISISASLLDAAKRNIVTSSMEEALKKLAYEDYMTGLANRAKLEEYIDELENARTGYTVVSFDLNYLKKVNDEFGHDVGDEYIKAFSSCLAKFFGDVSLIARTGGDEFLAILKGRSGADAKDRAVKMAEFISSNNDIFTKRKIEFAYGIAERREAKRASVKDALKLADSRMYEMKRLNHIGR